MRTRAWAGRSRMAAVTIVGLSLVGGAAVIARRRGWHGRHERHDGTAGGAGPMTITGSQPQSRPESRPEEPEVAELLNG